MSDLWESRLEAIALAQIALSILGNVGVPSGANVAVGMFAYLNSRKDARDLLISAAIHIGSILADIIMLCLHGSEWSSAGHEVAFGMSMIIINLFAKVAAILVMGMLFEEARSSGSNQKGTFSEIDDTKDIDYEPGGNGSYQND
uniref:Uncharacterized protein n=1 Tax=Lotharella globosa TaxID=91324 RepID=A0A6U2Y5X0_9EUKA|mmetsp:Transcript_15109/g.29697  ORF Transcript_15109/g.29697 Transcript_15109/m.29697 type:complete len:144 (-) Transcript_15109:319-750(-)|eukprot:CAMPEP_0167784124 /NCGR_PEP_ID=MMETSP0111_2-20121227/7460_1 /TAXON_ID=91324 /ORGANISM="Lotharella globosa, Strain CCCM811" /LENGTH=143 /DNA_ID=CAMNT_0007675155 /DNA_START=68 /DNA_END=499 /DNA_ORIENTATION=+